MRQAIEAGEPIQLAEDLPPEEATRYALSVEAGWICYPTTGGETKLAPAKPGASFEAVRAQMATRTPSSAIFHAIALPMPVAPP